MHNRDDSLAVSNLMFGDFVLLLDCLSASCPQGHHVCASCALSRRPRMGGEDRSEASGETEGEEVSMFHLLTRSAYYRTANALRPEHRVRWERFATFVQYFVLPSSRSRHPLRASCLLSSPTPEAREDGVAVARRVDVGGGTFTEPPPPPISFVAAPTGTMTASFSSLSISTDLLLEDDAASKRVGQSAISGVVCEALGRPVTKAFRALFQDFLSFKSDWFALLESGGYALDTNAMRVKQESEGGRACLYWPQFLDFCECCLAAANAKSF